jgi:hypothetical protein
MYVWGCCSPLLSLLLVLLLLRMLYCLSARNMTLMQQTGAERGDWMQQLGDMWSTTARQVARGWSLLHVDEVSTPETAADAVASVAASMAVQQQTEVQSGQVSRVTCEWACVLADAGCDLRIFRSWYLCLGWHGDVIGQLDW